ncbi:TLD-domain-containing protein [Endogone sp. FLAS-F59071]|nr:TLD-domain-containing protein [Endogone sp. FLAS-F59071]|eukprot:RUS15191.1 TLD-domain-containing protein [Endogone sp. FLAS-F59071]
MGNQQSHTSDRFPQFLNHLTSSERVALRLAFPVDNISREELAQRLPGHLAPLLRDSLVSYILSRSFKDNPATPNVSKFTAMAAVYSLSKSTLNEKADAFYDVFSSSNASLEQLVKEITRTAVQYWFQGSDLPWPTDTNHNDACLDRLTHQLLVASSATSYDDFLFESPTANTLNGWLDATRAFSSEKSRPSHSDINRWFIATPTFQHLLGILLSHLFLIPPSAPPPLSGLRPLNFAAPQITPPFSDIVTPFSYYFLNHHLPPDCRVSHTRIFSSRFNGTSWQAFTDSILDRGSTLLLVRDKNGHVFGAFAYQDWEMKPKFYGDAKNFLFTVSPEIQVYPGGTVNNNYQYLNFDTQSLPNGLGLGGQLDYFGLWIASDFEHGHSRAAPRCSTYGSPRLAVNEDFVVDEVEVWLVRPTIKDLDLLPPKGKRSALDHAEDVAFLEMGGRKMYSKEVKEQDAREDRERELEECRV